jgi:hypothetical protein
MGTILEGIVFSFNKGTSDIGENVKKGTILVLPKIIQLRRQLTKFFKNVRYGREFRMVFEYGDVWGRF